MTFMPLLLAGFLALGDSVNHETLYGQAVIAFHNGNTSDAEEKVQRLLRDNARKAEYYQLLGEVYINGGRLPEALAAFRSSSELQGDSDPATLKQLATISEWTRNFGEAKQWLNRTIRLAPQDDEARAGLGDLRLRRSFHLLGSVGGWEVDYVNSAREVGLFAGWIDWMDIYGGYSAVDHAFYRRTNVWADAYIFPNYQFYIRLGARGKSYEYPVSASSSPDQSAYRSVPVVQLEGAYMYDGGNSVSLELEYFRPNFYWNQSLRANNFKIRASFQNWLIHPIYAKLFTSILRDPDPAKLIIDPGTNALRSFGYETLNLLGGALGYDNGRINAEVKYIPNRDLDRSIDWSVFGRLRYDFGQYGIQYDMLYDNYSPGHSTGTSTSRVNMFTFITSPSPFLELRAGAKILTKETSQLAPFLYVRVKTGV